MRTVSQQIGWSQEAKLLYEIQRELDYVYNTTWNTIVNPTTTTTTTTGNFSGMVSWGVDSATACAGTNSFIMTADNSPTFCSNLQTAYIGAGWGNISIDTGIYYISYGGNVRRVNHTAGDDYAVAPDFELCASC
jgi:uncharacterized protein (DUF736 family)